MTRAPVLAPEFIATIARDNERALGRLAADAKSQAHTLASLELEHRIEGLRWELSAYTGEDLQVATHLFAPTLVAYEAELARRQMLERTGGLMVPVRSARSEALGELAALIRERVQLANLLEREGFAVQRQRGTAGGHASRPLSVGSDRFVVWDAPGSRGWCRQFGYRVDVLALARTLWQCSFPEAVERLAAGYLAARAA